MVLNYWIEDTSKLWVKVPTIKTGETTTLRIYKTSGYSPSGNDTFEFFDDFTGTYSDNWEKVSDSGGSSSFDTYDGESVLKIFKSGNYGTTEGVQSKTTFPYTDLNNVFLITRRYVNYKNDFESGGGWGIAEDEFILTRRFSMRFSSYLNVSSLYSVYDGSNVTDQDTALENGWWKEKISFSESDDTIYGEKYDETLDTTYNYSVINQFPSFDITSIDMRIYFSNFHRQHYDYFDYIAVGKTIDSSNVTITDKTEYYEIQINNTSGSDLSNYQISLDASDLGTLSNDESLKIEKYSELYSTSIMKQQTNITKVEITAYFTNEIEFQITANANNPSPTWDTAELTSGIKKTHTFTNPGTEVKYKIKAKEGSIIYSPQNFNTNIYYSGFPTPFNFWGATETDLEIYNTYDEKEKTNYFQLPGIKIKKI